MLGRRSVMATCAVVFLLAGCGQRDVPELMQLRSETPDEFSIVPSRPLALPQDYASLPEPAPGQGNRADPAPLDDAVVALGGDPAAASAGGLPTADLALIAAVAEEGVEPDIRETLAEEDIEFRRRNRGDWVGRQMGRTQYFKAYAPQSLDAHKEVQTFREQGVRTPAAPPRR